MTPTSLVQLAQDWRGTVPPGGCFAEQKIDGWRAARFPGIDGKVRLWTRNGHPIEGTGHILWALDRLERAAGEPMVFDGEFQVDGTLDATKRWCERGWNLGGEAGVYHLFDCLPLRLWRAGGDPTPYYQRKDRLKALWDAVQGEEWEWRPGSRGRDEGATPLILARECWLFTADDVVAMAEKVWAAGGEGVMLKHAEAPYQRKRSDAWLKVKQENRFKWEREERRIAA